MQKFYYIYILANKKRGVIYIGQTGNLSNRIWQHKNSLIDGFTKKYHLNKLVYFESTENLFASLERERQLKNWHRQWKIALIEQNNPEWHDLSNAIT